MAHDKKNGRPKTLPEDAKSILVRLDDRHRRIASDLGGGVISAGIRKALDIAIRHMLVESIDDDIL